VGWCGDIRVSPGPMWNWELKIGIRTGFGFGLIIKPLLLECFERKYSH